MGKAISGMFGTLKKGASEIVETKGWKLQRKAAVHQYASNTSGRHKRSVAGTKRGTVSFSGGYDEDDPIDDHIEEGDEVTLLGYVNATAFYTIPMVVEDLDLEVDFDEGAIVGWSVSGPTDGAWTKPT